VNALPHPGGRIDVPDYGPGTIVFVWPRMRKGDVPLGRLVTVRLDGPDNYQGGTCRMEQRHIDVFIDEATPQAREQGA
jgi:hypothetical protein